jgi:hypothetical protein
MSRWALLVAVLPVCCVVQDFLTRFKTLYLVFYNTHPEDGRCRPKHRTNFYEVLYLSIFRKSLEKIRVPLKSDKNNGYFT